MDTGKKILFVDDNQEITRLVTRYLKLKNYDIAVVNDSRDVISLIKNKKFDIILLDISMPRISGFDIIDTLAGHETIKDKKIILLTGVEISKGEIEELLEKGVHSVLLKPVEMDTLIQTIESDQIIAK